MASGVRVEASDLDEGLKNLLRPVVVRMYAETQAKSLEGYAKEHRPWTDRTGDARKRLTGYVTETNTGYRITLAHGVNYGLWLELAMEKRYAILEPTIRLKGSEVLRGLKNLLDRL